MTKLFRLCVFLLVTVVFSTGSMGKLPSLEYIKRLGKNCTGFCDQPSIVCPSETDKKEDAIKWCEKHCSHKIDINKVCAADWKIGSKGKCTTKTTNEQRRVHAASAARIVFSKGKKGGYSKDEFKEVGHLDDEKGSGLVAWAGISDCILYISFRGSETERDWYEKDFQLGVANILDTFKLGQLASRGGYNNAVNKGIEFFHKITQKEAKKYEKVVITGHSLGGAYAQSVGGRVAVDQKNVYIITLDAPGSAFSSSSVTSAPENTEHLNRGDVVSSIGRHTPGEKIDVESNRAKNPFDHSMRKIHEGLEVEVK